MLEALKARLYRLLRWSERYTKTDMVYLATSGFWLNLDLVTQSVLSLALSVALANLLSPTVYGTYQYLVAIAALVAAVALSGMNSAVTQAVARGYEGVFRASIRTQLRWAVVPGLLSLAGALYYFIQGNAELGFGLTAIGLFTPLVQTFNTYVAFLAGKREFRASFFLKLIANLFYYVPMFVILPFAHGAALFITVNVIMTALGNFYAYRATLKRYAPNDAVDPAAVKYGKHLSVMGGFGTVMHQLDSVLVFHFLGPSSLAVYALATMLPERVAGFSGFITSATLPKFANQPLSYIRPNLIPKVMRIAFASIIVALLYAAAAPIIFRLLFPGYLSAIPFTQGYAAIIVLMSVSALTNVTLYAKRFTQDLYALGFVQPILLVGLQVPLLLLYGIWGMIVARLISDAVGLGLALLFTFHPLSKEVRG